jgi:hypothetical protein
LLNLLLEAQGGTLLNQKRDSLNVLLSTRSKDRSELISASVVKLLAVDSEHAVARTSLERGFAISRSGLHNNSTPGRAALLPAHA